MSYDWCVMSHWLGVMGDAWWVLIYEWWVIDGKGDEWWVIIDEWKVINDM